MRDASFGRALDLFDRHWEDALQIACPGRWLMLSEQIEQLERIKRAAIAF